MKFEPGICPPDDVDQQDQAPPAQLAPAETVFSCGAAASRCEDVAAHLVQLAGLLKSTRAGTPADQPSLPPSALVKCLIKARRMREQFFDADLFADPVWDILLELYLARLEQRTITMTSLCIASAVPQTTALRHIQSLTERNLVVRLPNPSDGRMVYVELRETAFSQMHRLCERLIALLGTASERNHGA